MHNDLKLRIAVFSQHYNGNFVFLQNEAGTFPQSLPSFTAVFLQQQTNTCPIEGPLALLAATVVHGETRGDQLVVKCNLSARCHKILHTGRLTRQ